MNEYEKRLAARERAYDFGYAIGHQALLDNLVGQFEIAEHFGVTRGAVYNWQVRDGSFPQPVKRLSSGPLFDMRAVQAWSDAKQ